MLLIGLISLGNVKGLFQRNRGKSELWRKHYLDKSTIYSVDNDPYSIYAFIKGSSSEV